MDDDEGEVAFELAIDGADGLGQVVAAGGGQMPLDQVDDDFRVGLGAERVALGDKRLLQFAVVLHDRVLVVVATREGMGVLLGDGAVRRPARVSEAVIRLRAVRPGGVLQELEIADGADVIELAVLAQRDPGGVIAPVLQPLEPPKEQFLRCPISDVPDDAAHGTLLSLAAGGFSSRNVKSPALSGPSSGRQPSSRRTRAAMVAQRSAAFWGFSASANTRMTGSVPDGRTRTRPSVPSSALTRSTSARMASVSSLRATAKFSLTCGKRGITAVSSASGRPRSPPQRRSAAASPSPATWPSSQMMWPDCSPPRIPPSRRSASRT